MAVTRLYQYPQSAEPVFVPPEVALPDFDWFRQPDDPVRPKKTVITGGESRIDPDLAPPEVLLDWLSPQTEVLRRPAYLSDQVQPTPFTPLPDLDWLQEPDQPLFRVKRRYTGGEKRSTFTPLPDVDWLPAVSQPPARAKRRHTGGESSPVFVPPPSFGWFRLADQPLFHVKRRLIGGGERSIFVPLPGLDWLVQASEVLRRPRAPIQLTYGLPLLDVVPEVPVGFHALPEAFLRRHLRRVYDQLPPILLDIAPVSLDWLTLSPDPVRRRVRIQAVLDARNLTLPVMLPFDWLPLLPDPVRRRPLVYDQSHLVHLDVVPLLPLDWLPLLPDPVRRRLRVQRFDARDVTLPPVLPLDWLMLSLDPVRRSRRTPLFEIQFPSAVSIVTFPPAFQIQVCFVPWEVSEHELLPNASGHVADALLVPAASGFAWEPTTLTASTFSEGQVIAMTPSGFFMVLGHGTVTASGLFVPDEPDDPSGYTSLPDVRSPSGYVQDEDGHTIWDWF